MIRGRKDLTISAVTFQALCLETEYESAIIRNKEWFLWWKWNGYCTLLEWWRSQLFHLKDLFPTKVYPTKLSSWNCRCFATLPKMVPDQIKSSTQKGNDYCFLVFRFSEKFMSGLR